MKLIVFGRRFMCKSMTNCYLFMIWISTKSHHQMASNSARSYDRIMILGNENHSLSPNDMGDFLTNWSNYSHVQVICGFSWYFFLYFFKEYFMWYAYYSFNYNCKYLRFGRKEEKKSINHTKYANGKYI